MLQRDLWFFNLGVIVNHFLKPRKTNMKKLQDINE